MQEQRFIVRSNETWTLIGRTKIESEGGATNGGRELGAEKREWV